MSAQLLELPRVTREDVSSTLREIAGMVDAGLLGCECEAVLVLKSTTDLSIFPLGKADPGTMHLLMHAGMLKMANTLL